MSDAKLVERLVILDGHDAEPACHHLGCGTVGVFSRACPTIEQTNEDALGVIPVDDQRAVLLVADGFGGHPSGDQAARLAIEAVAKGVSRCLEAGTDLRGGILDGFEGANRAVSNLGVGAATTLAVAEVNDGVVRSYHAGDSEIMIVGQRGKLKLQTVSHSPVGYGVEAGLIDSDDAMHHVERNVVSNMIGSPDMRIDIGPRVRLRPRDTLFLATDGIFDNISVPDLTDQIRTGSIETCCRTLVELCTARMTHPESGVPSKPDDAALILFRLR